MAAHYRSENFAARDCVGYLISRVQSLMRPQIEAVFDKQDLTFSQWRVLMCLRDGIANTCADISRELSHDSGSLTRLADQLDRRGLIHRTRDRKDRRVVTLALTPAGRAAIKAVLPNVVAHFNDLLEGFSAHEAKMLVALLTRLLVRASEIEDRESGVRERAA
jgi:DNA-binding MarR family transcriptional regulator